MNIPHNHTETSIAAAESMKPTAESICNRVLKFIKSKGEHGATDDEIEIALGLKKASPRRRSLVVDFEIVNSGRFRKTSSGRMARVWIGRKLAKDPVTIQTTQLDVIKSKMKSAIQEIDNLKSADRAWSALKSAQIIDPPHTELKRLRLKMKLTQLGAGDICGIEQAEFSRVERDLYSPLYPKCLDLMQKANT